jgi:hypothetical protein
MNPEQEPPLTPFDKIFPEVREAIDKLRGATAKLMEGKISEKG